MHFKQSIDILMSYFLLFINEKQGFLCRLIFRNYYKIVGILSEIVVSFR